MVAEPGPGLGSHQGTLPQKELVGAVAAELGEEMPARLTALGQLDMELGCTGEEFGLGHG